MVLSLPKKRLFLIDGYGFVFRAFHAVRELTSPDGTPVNAVYGFTNMLMKQRQKVQVNNGDYMVVVFDAGKQSFRNDLYPAYKANRPPAPPELIPQFPLVREAVAALGLPSVELEGYEADDLIATYTIQAKAEGMEVTIISSDKDLMQLVGEGVQMYDAMKDKIVGITEVHEKFGVAPCQVLDVLALMGDSSDNIPGVPSIGPKTAAELLQQWGDLEGILANTASIKQEKRRQVLETYADQARLSRKLAMLEVHAPVPTPLIDFIVREELPEEVLPFLQKVGFKSLIAKFESKHGVQAHAVTDANPSAQSTIVQNYSALTTTTLLQWLEQSHTTGTLAILPLPTGVALATSIGNAAFVPYQTDENEIPTPQDDLFSGASTKQYDESKTIWRHLMAFLGTPSILTIGYDLKAIAKAQSLPITKLHPFDDVLVMSYTLDGARHSHAIANLAQMQLGIMLTEEKEALTTESACAMVDALLQLHQHFKQRLFLEKMLTLYETIERPLVRVLSEMEQTGIKVDGLFLQNLSEEFSKKLIHLEKEIYGLAGKEFTIGSPKQLGEVLFEEMGLQGGKKSKKTGSYSTDASVLEQLTAEGKPIAEKLLAWRGLSKLRSTYTEALQREINPYTGRVHSTFAMAATTTGRLSSLNPNLQNIPIRTEEGRRIRTAFIAEKGWKLIAADYSQIELRLLAHIADITPLKQAFLAGEDIHAKTASQVFGLPLAEVTSAQRRAAKAINFGIIYGQSAYGLATNLGIPQSEAKQYIEAYFKEYAGIRRFMDATIEDARTYGYVTTLFGRKCYVPDINVSGARRAFAERAAINAPLQGSAADIIKKAMVVLQRALQKGGFATKIVLQVHDELLLEAPESEVETMLPLVKHTMEQVCQLSIPLTVDAKSGNHWGEVH